MIQEKGMCSSFTKSTFHSSIHTYIHSFNKYLFSAYSTCSSIETERMGNSNLNPSYSIIKCLIFVNSSFPDIVVTLMICEYDDSKSSGYVYICYYMYVYIIFPQKYYICMQNPCVNIYYIFIYNTSIDVYEYICHKHICQLAKTMLSGLLDDLFSQVIVSVVFGLLRDFYFFFE